MKKEDRSDVIDDIRWTTLCHYADDLMNSNRMRNLERINLGAYIIATVIKTVPEKEQFRWFAHVLQEMSSQSAGLLVLPVTEKV